MKLKIKFDEDESGGFSVLKGIVKNIPKGWVENFLGHYAPPWDECRHRRVSTSVRSGDINVVPHCLLFGTNVTAETCVGCELREPELVQIESLSWVMDVKQPKNAPTVLDLMEHKREEARQVNRPGTELKRILVSWGIKSDKECGCQDHATRMDQLGVVWCRQNVETIVDWMMDAARDKWWAKLLAHRFLARRLVFKAIQNCEVNLVQKTK